MTLRAWRPMALVPSLVLLGIACGGTSIGPGSGDASTSNDAGDGGSSGDSTVRPGEDGAAPGQDGGMPVVDGSRPVDAGAGGIPCGAATCSPETQECCIGVMAGESCSPKGMCDGGVAVGCSGPESCPSGDVCCAEGMMGGGIGGAKVSCTGAMACMGVLLCQGDSDCPNGEMCQMAFGGFKFCRRHHMFGDGGFRPPAMDGGGMPPVDAGAGG